MASFALLASILACGRMDPDAPPPVVPIAPTYDAPPGPAPAPAATPIALAPGFTPEIWRTAGTAGGVVDASTLAPSCRGFVNPQPNHTLSITAPFATLHILVDSPADTTLVVRTPAGTYLCNDDSVGLNPGVDGSFAVGSYAIFVGSYSPSGTPTYTLGVTESRRAQLGGGAPPPIAGDPIAMGSPPAPAQMVRLARGFQPDPWITRGVAGGPIRATSFDRSCRGSVPSSPQHLLMLQDDVPILRVMVNSAADTTLVIRGPDGLYTCNDDSEGFRPAIERAWGAGTYQIWVGRYSGGMAPYTLGISERAEARPSSLPL